MCQGGGIWCYVILSAPLEPEKAVHITPAQLFTIIQTALLVLSTRNAYRLITVMLCCVFLVWRIGEFLALDTHELQYATKPLNDAGDN